MDYVEFLKDTEYEALEPYVNALTKINHLHKPCGFIWNTRPNDIKNRFKKGLTTGCPGCGKAGRLTQAQYEQRLIGTEFEVLGKYINNRSPILHKHTICGKESLMSPMSIMDHGRLGCSHCGKVFKQTTEGYVEKLKDSEYELLEEYTGSKDKLLHRHKVCGTEFLIRPNDILSGHGCNTCAKGRNYSKLAIEWINTFNNPSIIHAENGGEQKIAGYKVDGYDPNTNTVYEFHGDRYHGNLDIFSPDELCHPFDKTVTADELWTRTFERMQTISQAAKVVYIWEQEYRDGKSASIF
jgi:hypothetical protein